MENQNRSLNQSNNIQDNKSKRELSADDSLSFIKELKSVKNDPEAKVEALEIIDEETKKYVDDMKKGTYNILV